MKRWTAALTAVVMIAALLCVAMRPAAAQDNSNTYQVQPGDNLYRISLKFNVTMDALIKANGIVNADQIFVGQKLIIPSANGTATPSAVPGSATAAVTPGSTTDSGIISTSTPTAAPTSTTAPTGTTTPSAPVSNPGTYRVQPGDNLYRIALKFGTSVQVLMQLNNLPNANVVYVGQVLNLPGGNGSTGQPGTTPAFTVTPSNTSSNVGFQFGIAADLRNQDVNQIATQVNDIGAKWIKVPVQWRLLEATKGTIDATTLDAQIDALSSSGLQIMLTVYTAPDWARPTTAESGPPTNFADYANFVNALATRYKGKVQAYEVWNEPNIRREWNGRPLSAASYVEMLRLAYDGIKQADPAALVVSAGLSPTGYHDGVNAIADRTFLRQAYAAGLAAYSDAVGVHSYGWANPPDSTCCSPSAGVSGWFNDRSFYFRDTLKDYRDIMSQNSDAGTYLWATEFGWPSSEGVVKDVSSIDPNFGFVNFVSQTQQAQYIPRAFEMARTLGYVGPMFLFNLNYCTTSGGDETSTEFKWCYYSLLDVNGNPRPAYQALKSTPKQ